MPRFQRSAVTIGGSKAMNFIYLRALVVSCFLIGLSTPVGAAGAGLLQADLDEQRNNWQDSGILHYNFRFQQTCFCAPDSVEPGIVSVVGGQIESVIGVNTSEELNPSLFLSIDGLFDALQDALDQPADAISANFDKSLGYPTDISIDFIELASDDEIWYAATDLNPTSMIPGDADLNGVVNFEDFVVLTNNFNLTDTDWRHGNFDFDGITNLKDFTILANHFGESMQPEQSVPEPGAMILLSVAILVARREHLL